ncbi:MAG TPA: FtsX-like permease family protein [Acidimicrobiales bacterium]|jgi:putative ABC transport system permease protein|nr:FtsX-like permease family protein [Acidimicrobiales bacterium]
MSVDVLERPSLDSVERPSSGGVPARRAMLRWSWRLFKREWRQQFLILLLIVVAVAATVVGSAVAVNTPPPANAGFGTAHDLATFNLTPTAKSGTDSPSYVAAQTALLEHRFGRVQIIANETFSVPGSTQTYQLRSQDPDGPYGGPMLQLLSGSYPTGADQIALTPKLASELNLSVGDAWPLGGKTVVGIVENPQSLLDEFALVPPGQVAHPNQVNVLFDASPSAAKSLPTYVTTPGANNNNIIGPETIILALATVGMLLIALVSIGGFTVLAQRRMRSLGMVESMGATDRNVRLVLEANGVIVGFIGALVGFALGLGLWLAYRPHNEQSAHHVIGTFALPWVVVVPAMVLAVVATFFAAGYPARAITRVPVVSALAGRPAPPRQIHRSLVPGVVALVIGFFLFSVSGASGNGGGVIWLVPGLIALIVGIILVSPFFLALLARVGGRSPIAIRLPLRDMARYRARSGSALSAISFGIMIAVIICAVAVARYSNVFDFVGPNMAANTINVYTPPAAGTELFSPGQNGPQTETAPAPPSLSAQAATAHAIAAAVGANDVVELVNAAVGLQNPSSSGRQWDGPIYVATPALLRAYGINSSSIPSDVDILSARPGLAGSGVQLTFGGGGKGGDGFQGLGAGGNNSNQCTPNQCLAHPVVQEESQLPIGTSSPNTVITESALHRLHVASQNSLGGWTILANSPITEAQLTSANSLAAAGDLSIESNNDAPTSAEIVNWATVFGIALALGVLAMSVGLIRSETANELRTLTATGASSRTRRSLTAVTAGGLAFLGALLGTLAAYVGLFGWFRSNAQEGGVSDIINHVPWDNLVFILIAMPVAAVLIGWVLAGREPRGIGTRPVE